MRKLDELHLEYPFMGSYMLDWYNVHRSHSNLERLTLNEKYLAGLTPMAQAA